MIAATVTSELYKVDLTLTGAPSITDAFDEAITPTGLGITYANGEPTAIRFEIPGDYLFVAPADLDKPENWPGWLRELVEQHRPASN
jgi:hypothetical protein